ncbi:MAG: winged helix-turn-helix transcriptional regulator [Candidatus Nitrosocosmicus sp.]
MEYSLDKVDLKIIYLFSNNSRMSFRSMSSDIGLTSKSIKARVEKMISQKVIRSFFLIVNPSVFGYNKICVLKGKYGKKICDTDVFNLFSSMGNILTRIQYLGRGFAYSLAINDKSENEVKSLLDSLNWPIKYKIFQFKNVPSQELSKTDLKIMQCLLENPRMDINRVAGQISLSSKTVTRHLDKMIQNHVLRFSILCDSSSTFGYLQFSITLSVDESRYYLIHHYVSTTFKNNIFYVPRAFATPPNEMRFFLFSKNLSSIEKMLIELESIDGIKSIELFVVLSIETYTEWITKEIYQRL